MRFDGDVPVGKASDAAGRAKPANVVVQAWYPAVSLSQVSRGMMDDVLAKPVSDAPIAAEPKLFPVVFFNPGWGGSQIGHMVQITALVRNGFVVVGIWHRPGPERPDRFLDFTSDAAYDATRQAIGRLTVRDAGDNLMILESLRRGATMPFSVLGHRLDYDRLGVLGYSYGGAVAAQTCWMDRSIRAAVNMDGWLFADAAAKGFSQPFLEMSDSTPLPSSSDLTANDTRRRLEAQQNITDDKFRQVRLARYGGYTLIVDNTNHQSFIDPQARPLAGQILAAWSLRSQRNLTIVVDYTVAFFRKFLKGEPAPLFDISASPYPEAHLTVWTRHDLVP